MSATPTERAPAEARDALEAAAHPRRGDIWKHFRGGLYRVLDIALLESDASTWMVIYQRVSHDEFEEEVPWVRPVSSWMETAPTGAPRFTLRARTTEESHESE